MIFSKKLLIGRYQFPTYLMPPTTYTTTIVASAAAGNYTIYTVPEDGWYVVLVKGGAGNNGAFGYAGSVGGGTEQMIYMYQNETCLLWAGSSGTTGTTYPGTASYNFGGRGGYGHDESGAGGGAPASSGTGNPHWEGGLPGQGSGFIAGFTNVELDEQSLTAGTLTRSINYSLDATVVQFTSIATYIMAGGGGGGCSDNGDNRSQGGGGGAFGNGGNAWWTQEYGTSGPAGTWGAGEDGSRYGGGGRGAWAIIDFSTGLVDWGRGNSLASPRQGLVTISKVIPTIS